MTELIYIIFIMFYHVSPLLRKVHWRTVRYDTNISVRFYRLQFIFGFSLFRDSVAAVS